MTQIPILRALSSIRKSGAKTLLMGGQACIFYGASEHSRDLDVMLLSDPANLDRFRSALEDLQAQPIAVPPFDVEHLHRGHSIHFRCFRDDVRALRLDVMSVLRGVGSFAELWERRTVMDIEGQPIDVMGIEDLVLAKKTQRDKDWPMIAGLVNQSFYRNVGPPNVAQVNFWLRELRTPELLMRIASEHPEAANRIAESRPALRAAIANNADGVENALYAEEREERRLDREYWNPLKRELEQLRHAQRRERQP